jgi:uncharacterized protein
MVRLQPWQWLILGLPIALLIGGFFSLSALQLHEWGLNWLWAIFILVFVGWRWLLVRWLQPSPPIEWPPRDADSTAKASGSGSLSLQAQSQQKLQQILAAAQFDPPPWSDWSRFFDRCQEVVTAIAQVYAPDVKRPLLSIYIPQAYGLIRGTVDDVDLWMQKLSPMLGQVSIGQAYEAYEVYQRLEPTARWVWRIWNASQWFFNPVSALTRASTEGSRSRANQQLLANLGQMLRQETLQALGSRAIALYSGSVEIPALDPSLQQPQPTETLREIFAQAQDPQALAAPVNLLLVGRTGAGKSSLINTLFVQDQAVVDLLPSTDRLQDYHWQSASGDQLILWDAPGYEQIGRPDLRQLVLEKAATADALLLLTPATDPAVQMDIEFLQAVRRMAADLPIFLGVTQVDRLRPLREWQPPYDWHQGDRPKEIAIREAIAYRQSHLGAYCQTLLPLVNPGIAQGRVAWGITELAAELVAGIDPAKQFRLSRFFQDREARIAVASKIIDRYALQMGTTQGITALLKRPLLGYLSTLITGSPTLAILLSEKLPLEQAPVILSKLQMAYELFCLLAEQQGRSFDLLALWPLCLETSAAVHQDAWALGHTLAEYWADSLSTQAGEMSTDALRQRYRDYSSQSPRTFSP